MSDKSTDTMPPFFAEIADFGKTAWWMILLRGIFAILFGTLAIIFPDATLVALALIFAFYAIFDGITTIVHAVRVRKFAPRWGWLLAQGIFTVIAGVVAAIFPVLAGLFGAFFIIYLIAFWSVFSGVTGFRAAKAMASGSSRTWAYVSAVFSIIFGIALVVIAAITPLAAILSLVIVIGIYAIVLGVMLIAFAISVRSAAKDVMEETA